MMKEKKMLEYLNQQHLDIYYNWVDRLLLQEYFYYLHEPV